MVVWKNIIKSTIRALIPTVIFPLFGISLIIYHFGISIDAILIIVMLAQFYIIWFQAEISLRQTKFNEFKYEPLLSLKLQDQQYQHKNAYLFALSNIGEYPAYNAFYTIHSNPRYRESERIGMIGSIEPGEKKSLFNILNDELKKYSEFELSINYDNAFGKPASKSFSLPQRFIPHPLIISGKSEMPGILFNSIEDLQLIFSMITLNREIKKIKKEQKN